MIRQPRILLIEDEDEYRDITSRLLKVHGFDVRVAPDGVDAIYLLNEVDPDLVITDLAMPTMPGWSLLSAIRKDPNYHRLPVIAMTAFHTTKSPLDAGDAGFDAYFSKPLDVEKLVAKIKELLGT